MGQNTQISGVSAVARELGIAVSTMYERWPRDSEMRAIINRIEIGGRTYWTASAADCARWRKARAKVKAARKAARS